MTSRFSVESTAPHNPSAMNKPHLRGMGAPTPRGGLAYEERKTEMEDVFEVLAEDHEEIGAIEATGLGISWKDGDPGIGPAYLFRDPDGHELELYWETEWYSPPQELKPSLKNQAQAYPGRGVCVRRLDHVNYLAADVPPSGEFV